MMPAEPDNKPDPSMRGVASLMAASPDPFTREVAALLEDIASVHDQRIGCDICNQIGSACAGLELANSVAFAWLLKVIEERG